LTALGPLRPSSTSKITLLCKPFCKALVEAHPSIDKIVHHLSETENNYDLWIELRGDWNTLFKAFFHQPQIRLDRFELNIKE
jgi:ADP-heptose:LPS heptosyltransferase